MAQDTIYCVGGCRSFLPFLSFPLALFQPYLFFLFLTLLFSCFQSRPPSASPAAGVLSSSSESDHRRRWSPSPPSGAGGAAVAASRGTPELPRAPSASLAELLAPRRRPSGRGNARSPPPPGPVAPPNSRQGIAPDPIDAAPNGGRKRLEFPHQIVFFPQLGSHSSAPWNDNTLCTQRSQRD